MQSRDIASGFTNLFAHKWYSMRACPSAPRLPPRAAPEAVRLTGAVRCLLPGRPSTTPGSYAHFCFFEQISASTKRADDFAFFVFFTFKSASPSLGPPRRATADPACSSPLLPGWKEVLIADAPRQVINGITLFSFGKVFGWQTDDLTAYYDNNYVTLLLLLAMIYTVVIFAVSFVLLVAAAIFYIPLLCHIKGNLKVRPSLLCVPATQEGDA